MTRVAATTLLLVMAFASTAAGHGGATLTSASGEGLSAD